MRWALVPVAAWLAACGPDSTPFEIRFELQRGDSYKCSSDNCANIGMSCDSAVMIRIVDADDENVAYLQQCEYIQANGALCELGTVTLEPVEVPNHAVRIQIAVWSLDEVDAFNPALRAANECPSMTFEPISGEPAVQPSPALWGQAYFQVGSSSVASVVLNCGDIGSLDTESCQGTGRVHVKAGVNDFAQLLPVDATIDLTVSTGEPRAITPSGASFDASMDDQLSGTVQGTWEGDRLEGFLSSACIEVVGMTLQAASTLQCTPVVPEEVAGTTLELEGVYIENSTIDKIEQAVGSLPTEGVVIGKVIDSTATPVEGAVVTTSDDGTITYLSSDMTTTVADSTSSSGVFVSKDVDYFDAITRDPTTWTATVGGTTSSGVVVGGVVRNHVTIVLLRMP